MNSQLLKDEMTPKERLDALLQGKPYDRIPCSLNVGAHASRILGIKAVDYNLSVDKQVEGIIAAYKEYGVELVGPFANYLAPLGLKFIIPEDSTPYVAEPLIKEYSDLDKLEIPDAKKALESLGFWEILQRVKQEIGDEVPIQIGFSGPFTAASQLRGIDNFMRDLYRNPEFSHSLISFVTDISSSFAKEIGKYGVKFGIFDPVSSGALISARQYRQFSLPYEKRLIDAMKKGGDQYPMLHICGNTTKIWGDMTDSGAGILSLDNIIDIGAAKDQVGDKVVIMGNVNPTETMLLGNPNTVENNVLECIAKAGDSPKGYMMALGCGLPLNTPAENIHALVYSNRKYGSNLF